MSEHAILSASGAHRWINCTPSARLELEFADTSGAAAEEGTAAHALAEHKLRAVFGRKTTRPESPYQNMEMDAYTDGYVEFILELLQQTKQTCSDPLVLIEQRIDFSSYVPDGFGTGDCLIIADGSLQIIDFKYGQGVLVSAEDNPQMKLYALGALFLFNHLYDIHTVSMTIYQPRRENISTETLPTDALIQWAEEILKPKATLAFAGCGDYISGEWCRFCRAAVKCRARAEEKLKLTALEFALPSLLSDEEICVILSQLDELIAWATDIKEYAFQTALSGKEWPGYKLVAGRSTRRYTDETSVAETIKAAGYLDIYKHSLLPITEMEALLGKKRFSELLSGLISKPLGKPTLVPNTDKRPAYQTAQAKNEFREE